jgi:nitrate/TMAO reductase-like tetraheme cytochrome c subunit
MKKTFIALLIVIGLVAGVLVYVGTTYAQEVTPEETTEDSVSEPLEMQNEFEYAQQNGNQAGVDEPIMTQARTRTQLQELQEDGECTGECDPQQIRLQQNNQVVAQGELRQQKMNLENGINNGDCIHQGQGRGRSQ